MESNTSESNRSAGATGVRLSEIGQIALTVQDVERARDFYQNTLGLPFLFSAGSMAFFQCGSIRLMIGTSEQGATDRATILYFRTEDIHGVHEGLRSRGVHSVREPHLVARMPDHDLWMSFFQDPDGNNLALMSEIARTP